MLNNAVSDSKAAVEILTGRYSFELIKEPFCDEQASNESILIYLSNAVDMLGEKDILIIYHDVYG